MSTKFIEYLLEKIKVSLTELVGTQRTNLTDAERLQYFLEQSGRQEFTRSDYLKIFPSLSSATATRDLRKGVDDGMLVRIGSDRLSRYRPA